MKKLFFGGVVAVMLVGCTSFGAVKDATEYERYVIVTLVASQTIDYCGTPDAGSYIRQLQNEVNFLELYTKHIPNNKESHEIAAILQDQVGELVGRNAAGMSKMYCVQKLNIIRQGSERAMDAVIQKRAN